MKLEDIKAEANKDSLNPSEPDLDEAALRITNLHRKWLDILTEEKLVLFKYSTEKNKLRHLKWLYYTGKMDQEDIKKLGWDLFNHRVVKSEVDSFLSSDEDLISIEMRIELQHLKIDYVESVLKEISNRNWTIRSALEWRKFTAGVH